MDRKQTSFQPPSQYNPLKADKGQSSDQWTSPASRKECAELRGQFVRCMRRRHERTGADRCSGLRRGLCPRRVVQFADMFLEVKVPAEALTAGGAGEGLFVVVRVHVEGEVVDLVEGFAAD